MAVFIFEVWVFIIMLVLRIIIYSPIILGGLGVIYLILKVLEFVLKAIVKLLEKTGREV